MPKLNSLTNYTSNNEDSRTITNSPSSDFSKVAKGLKEITQSTDPIFGYSKGDIVSNNSLIQSKNKPYQAGLPQLNKQTDSFLIVKSSSTIAYNSVTNSPDWVAWLTNKQSLGSVPRNKDGFKGDSDLTAKDNNLAIPLTDWFKNSGFDQGHVLRSGERTSSVYENVNTFIMSNVVAQTSDSNSGPWLDIENQLQQISLFSQPDAQGNLPETYNIAGGFGTGGFGKKGYKSAIIGPNGERVNVPAANFKVSFTLKAGGNINNPEDIISQTAVIMPNISGIREIDGNEYKTSISQVEKLTGLKFFSNVKGLDKNANYNSDTSISFDGKLDYTNMTVDRIPYLNELRLVTIQRADITNNLNVGEEGQKRINKDQIFAVKYKNRIEYPSTDKVTKAVTLAVATLPFNPTSLSDSYYKDFNLQTLPVVQLYQNLYEFTSGSTAVPNAVKDLDRELNYMGMGHRLNRFFKSNIYEMGSGPAGSLLKLFGKAIDDVTGQNADIEFKHIQSKDQKGKLSKIFSTAMYKPDDEEKKGFFESALVNMYKTAEGAAIATVSYVVVNKTIQHVFASVEATAINSLLEREETPSLIKQFQRRVIFGNAFASSFQQANKLSVSEDDFGQILNRKLQAISPANAILAEDGTVKKLSMSSNLGLLNFIGRVRQMDAYKLTTLVKPIFNDINPYTYNSVNYKNFNEAVDNVITTAKQLPQLKFTKDISDLVTNKPTVSNIGEERVRSIAKSWDKLAQYIPLNIAHWVPNLRQSLNLPEFDPTTDLSIKDVVSFDKLTAYTSHYLNQLGQSVTNPQQSLKDLSKYTSNLAEAYKIEKQVQKMERAMLVKTPTLVSSYAATPGADPETALSNVYRDARYKYLQATKQTRKFIKDNQDYFNLLKKQNEVVRQLNVISILRPEKFDEVTLKVEDSPGDRQAKGARKFVLAAGVFLLANKFLDDYLMSSPGISLPTQLRGYFSSSITTKHKDKEDNNQLQAYRYKFTDVVPSPVMWGIAVTSGVVAGKLLPNFIDITDATGGVRDRLQGNTSANIKAAAALALNEVGEVLESQSINTQKIKYLKAANTYTNVVNPPMDSDTRRVKGTFNTKLAVISTITSVVAAKVLFGAIAAMSNLWFNQEAGATYKEGEALSIALLNNLLKKQLNTAEIGQDFTNLNTGVFLSKLLSSKATTTDRTFTLANQTTNPFFQFATVGQIKPTTKVGGRDNEDKGYAAFGVSFQLLPISGIGFTLMSPIGIRLRESKYKSSEGLLAETVDKYREGLSALPYIGYSLLNVATFGTKGKAVQFAYIPQNGFDAFGTAVAGTYAVSLGMDMLHSYSRSTLVKNLGSSSKLVKEYDALMSNTKAARAITYGTYRFASTSLGWMATLPQSIISATVGGVGAFFKGDTSSQTVEQRRYQELTTRQSKTGARFAGNAIKTLLAYYIPLTAARIAADPANGYVGQAYADPNYQFAAALQVGLFYGTALKMSGVFASTEQLAADFRKATPGSLPVINQMFGLRQNNALNNAVDEVLEAGRHYKDPILTGVKRFTPKAVLMRIAAPALYQQGYARLSARNTVPFSPANLSSLEGASLRERYKYGFLLFAGMVLTAQLITSFFTKDSDLENFYKNNPFAPGIRLLAANEPKRNNVTQVGFQEGVLNSERYQGLGGVLSYVSKAATLGIFDLGKAIGLYADTANPFIGMGVFGASFKAKQTTGYFQFASEFTDLSASAFDLSKDTSNLDDLIQTVRALRGGTPRNLSVFLAIVRGAAPRATPMKISAIDSSQKEALSNSMGLGRELARRQALSQNLTWQRSSELRLDMIAGMSPFMFGVGPASGNLPLMKAFGEFVSYLHNPFAHLGQARFSVNYPNISRKKDQSYLANTTFNKPNEVLKVYGSITPLSVFQDFNNLGIVGQTFAVTMAALAGLATVEKVGSLLGAFAYSKSTADAKLLVKEARIEHLFNMNKYVYGVYNANTQDPYIGQKIKGSASHFRLPAVYEKFVNSFKGNSAVSTPVTLNTLKEQIGSQHARVLDNFKGYIVSPLDGNFKSKLDKYLDLAVDDPRGTLDKVKEFNKIKSSIKVDLIKNISTSLKGNISVDSKLTIFEALYQNSDISGGKNIKNHLGIFVQTKIQPLVNQFVEELSEHLTLTQANGVTDKNQLKLHAQSFMQKNTQFRALLNLLQQPLTAEVGKDIERISSSALTKAEKELVNQIVERPWSQTATGTVIKGLSQSLHYIAKWVFPGKDIYQAAEGATILLSGTNNPSLRLAASRNVVTTGLFVAEAGLISAVVNKLGIVNPWIALPLSLAAAYGLQHVKKNSRAITDFEDNNINTVAGFINAITKPLTPVTKYIADPLDKLFRIAAPFLSNVMYGEGKTPGWKQFMDNYFTPRTSYLAEYAFRTSAPNFSDPYGGQYIFGNTSLYLKEQYKQQLQAAQQADNPIDTNLIHSYLLGQAATQSDKLTQETLFKSYTGVNRTLENFSIGNTYRISSGLREELKRRQSMYDRTVTGQSISRIGYNQIGNNTVSSLIGTRIPYGDVFKTGGKYLGYIGEKIISAKEALSSSIAKGAAKYAPKFTTRLINAKAGYETAKIAAAVQLTTIKESVNKETIVKNLTNPESFKKFKAVLNVGKSTLFTVDNALTRLALTASSKVLAGLSNIKLPPKMGMLMALSVIAGGAIYWMFGRPNAKRPTLEQMMPVVNLTAAAVLVGSIYKISMGKSVSKAAGKVITFLPKLAGKGIINSVKGVNNFFGARMQNITANANLLTNVTTSAAGVQPLTSAVSVATTVNTTVAEATQKPSLLKCLTDIRKVPQVKATTSVISYPFRKASQTVSFYGERLAKAQVFSKVRGLGLAAFDLWSSVNIDTGIDKLNQGGQFRREYTANYQAYGASFSVLGASALFKGINILTPKRGLTNIFRNPFVYIAGIVGSALLGAKLGDDYGEDRFKKDYYNKEQRDPNVKLKDFLLGVAAGTLFQLPTMIKKSFVSKLVSSVDANGVESFRYRKSFSAAKFGRTLIKQALFNTTFGLGVNMTGGGALTTASMLSYYGSFDGVGKKTIDALNAKLPPLPPNNLSGGKPQPPNNPFDSGNEALAPISSDPNSPSNRPIPKPNRPTPASSFINAPIIPDDPFTIEPPAASNKFPPLAPVVNRPTSKLPAPPRNPLLTSPAPSSVIPDDPFTIAPTNAVQSLSTPAPVQSVSGAIGSVPKPNFTKRLMNLLGINRKQNDRAVIGFINKLLVENDPLTTHFNQVSKPEIKFNWRRGFGGEYDGKAIFYNRAVFDVIGNKLQGNQVNNAHLTNAIDTVFHEAYHTATQYGSTDEMYFYRSQVVDTLIAKGKDRISSAARKRIMDLSKKSVLTHFKGDLTFESYRDFKSIFSEEVQANTYAYQKTMALAKADPNLGLDTSIFTEDVGSKELDTQFKQVRSTLAKDYATFQASYRQQQREANRPLQSVKPAANKPVSLINAQRAGQYVDGVFTSIGIVSAIANNNNYVNINKYGGTYKQIDELTDQSAITGVTEVNLQIANVVTTNLIIKLAVGFGSQALVTGNFFGNNAYSAAGLLKDPTGLVNKYKQHQKERYQSGHAIYDPIGAANNIRLLQHTDTLQSVFNLHRQAGEATTTFKEILKDTKVGKALAKSTRGFGQTLTRLTTKLKPATGFMTGLTQGSKAIISSVTTNIDNVVKGAGNMFNRNLVKATNALAEVPLLGRALKATAGKYISAGLRSTVLDIVAPAIDIYNISAGTRKFLDDKTTSTSELEASYAQISTSNASLQGSVVGRSMFGVAGNIIFSLTGSFIAQTNVERNIAQARKAGDLKNKYTKFAYLIEDQGVNRLSRTAAAAELSMRSVKYGAEAWRGYNAARLVKYGAENTNLIQNVGKTISNARVIKALQTSERVADFTANFGKVAGVAAKAKPVLSAIGKFAKFLDIGLNLGLLGYGIYKTTRLTSRSNAAAVYSAYQTTGKATGALVGSVIGGAIGALGGPVVIVIGAAVGGLIGEAIGSTFAKSLADYRLHRGVHTYHDRESKRRYMQYRGVKFNKESFYKKIHEDTIKRRKQVDINKLKTIQAKVSIDSNKFNALNFIFGEPAAATQIEQSAVTSNITITALQKDTIALKQTVAQTRQDTLVTKVNQLDKPWWQVGLDIIGGGLNIIKSGIKQAYKATIDFGRNLRNGIVNTTKKVIDKMLGNGGETSSIPSIDFSVIKNNLPGYKYMPGLQNIIKNSETNAVNNSNIPLSSVSGKGETQGKLKRGGNELTPAQVAKLTPLGKYLYQYRNNKYVLALGDTIARAEGTDFRSNSKNYGYDYIFGGKNVGLAEINKGHPFVEGGRAAVKYSGGASTAAGRVQLLNSNYSSAMAKRYFGDPVSDVNLLIGSNNGDSPNSYSPGIQDLATSGGFYKRLGKKGFEKLVAGQDVESILSQGKLSQEYASLQAGDGRRSSYGQGTPEGQINSTIPFLRERIKARSKGGVSDTLESLGNGMTNVVNKTVNKTVKVIGGIKKSADNTFNYLKEGTISNLKKLGNLFTGGQQPTTVNNKPAPSLTSNLTPQQPITINAEAIAKQYGLQSLNIVDLKGNAIADYNKKKPPKHPASTIKLVVADLAINFVDPNKLYTVTQDNVAKGEDKYFAGTKLTGRELIRNVLRDSDNTSNNTLIKILGGEDAITALARKKGYNVNIARLSVPNASQYRNIASADDVTRATVSIFNNKSELGILGQQSLSDKKRFESEDHQAFGINNEVASKIGNNTKVIGNTSVIDIAGNKYIVTAFIDHNKYKQGQADTPQSRRDIRDASNQVVKLLTANRSLGMTALGNAATQDAVKVIANNRLSSPSYMGSMYPGVLLKTLAEYQPKDYQGMNAMRGSRVHNKIDFDGRVGGGDKAPVISMTTGRAIWGQFTDETDSGFVKVKTKDDKGRDVEITYGHLSLSSIQKAFGNKNNIDIAQGQSIGNVRLEQYAKAYGAHVDLNYQINGKAVNVQEEMKRLVKGGNYANSNNTNLSTIAEIQNLYSNIRAGKLDLDPMLILGDAASINIVAINNKTNAKSNVLNQDNVEAAKNNKFKNTLSVAFNGVNYNITVGGKDKDVVLASSNRAIQALQGNTAIAIAQAANDAGLVRVQTTINKSSTIPLKAFGDKTTNVDVNVLPIKDALNDIVPGTSSTSSTSVGLALSFDHGGATDFTTFEAYSNLRKVKSELSSDLRIYATSGAGMRTHPVTGKRKKHSGVDLGLPSGSLLRSPFTSAKISNESISGYGNVTVMTELDPKTGLLTGRAAMVAHLRNNSQLVKSGEIVKAGTVLATQGATGVGTGEHFHVEEFRGVKGYTYNDIVQGRVLPSKELLQAIGDGALNKKKVTTIKNSYTPTSQQHDDRDGHDHNKSSLTTKPQSKNLKGNYVLVTRSGVKNSEGFEDLTYGVYSNGRLQTSFTGRSGRGTVADSISGKSNTQIFKGSGSIEGSHEPFPQGNYSIGSLQTNASTVNNPAIGKTGFLPFTPNFNTARSTGGFHFDAASPGSAGCFVFLTKGDFVRFQQELKKYGVKKMVVDWRLPGNEKQPVDKATNKQHKSLQSSLPAAQAPPLNVDVIYREQNISPQQLQNIANLALDIKAAATAKVAKAQAEAKVEIPAVTVAKTSKNATNNLVDRSQPPRKAPTYNINVEEVKGTNKIEVAINEPDANIYHDWHQVTGGVMFTDMSLVSGYYHRA